MRYSLSANQKLLVNRAAIQQVLRDSMTRSSQLASVRPAPGTFRQTAKAWSRPAPFGEDLGPKTNIVLHNQFEKVTQPDRSVLDESKIKAMSFYRCLNSHRYGGRRTLYHAYSTAFLALAFPGVQQGRPHSALLRNALFATGWSGPLDRMAKMKDFLRVKVIPRTNGFLVDVPILWRVTEDDIRKWYDVFIDKWNVKDKSELARPADMPPNALKNKFYTAADVLKAVKAAGPQAIWMKAAHDFTTVDEAGFNVDFDGQHWNFSMSILFDSETVEKMTQTPWEEVRPIDFYGMIREWSSSRLGADRSLPKHSIPLKRIIGSLPKGGTPRVSKDLNILIDDSAAMWWLPSMEPKMGKFDSELTQFLKRPDGAYSAMPYPSEAGTAIPKPPRSGLIALDWVNAKMTYVNGEGNPTVQDISRAVAAQNRHYAELLSAPLVSRGLEVVRILQFAEFLGKPFLTDIQGELTIDGIQKVPGSIAYYMKQNGLCEDPEGNPTLYDVYEQRNNDTRGILSKFVSAVKVLCDYAQNSVENLYERFTFETTSHVVAAAVVLNAKWAKAATVLADAKVERDSYRASIKADPKYRLPAIPYVAEGRALQPHQMRTMSRLRDNPKFALLGVAAGGGKTILAITDYLKMVEQGLVMRGLIMCPAHLVAQYVKEFLYFTDSRVNVIAVTGHTLETHGLDTLMQMIETAPPNTVVVVDYFLARGSSKWFRFGYGQRVADAFPLVDTLRRVHFDWVFCDESHKLKNLESTTSKATGRLLAEIPYKRLASGTLTPNRVSDLVAQVNLMDPTIFPSETFESDFMKVNDNGRQVWDVEAIWERLRDNVQYIQVQRKEWAAWLPKQTVKFEYVKLTPAQMEVYRTLVTQQSAELMKLAKVNKKFGALMAGKISVDSDGDEEESDDEEGGDEEVAADAFAIDDLPPVPKEGLMCEDLLQQACARLEQFVAAPGRDKLGGHLKGEDAQPPKLSKLVSLYQEHMEGERLNEDAWPRSERYKQYKQDPDINPDDLVYRRGKILVFCNYIKEAEALYDGLPDSIKSRTIHYTAERKAKCAAQFENDDNIDMMIGVESSMNTGLNLQFASHLVRISAVWTPGALEQGDARILRPNLKGIETRPGVKLTWIMCENTVDMLKQAFLYAKKVTIGKFEEYGNPAFDHVEDPPIIKMSPEFMFEALKWDKESVAPWIQSFGQYQMAIWKEFEEYRVRNLADMENGRPKMVKLKRSPNQEHAKLMYRVPYVPGLDLYGTEDLDLVRYDQFVKIDESEFNIPDDVYKAMDAVERKMYNQVRIETELPQVEGKGVHTEYGEGIITGITLNKVRIRFNDGTTRSVDKLSCFVIGRKQTSGTDMRVRLLKQIGDVPFDAPEPPAVDPKSVTVKRRAAPEEEQHTIDEQDDEEIQMALDIVVYNDFLGLRFVGAKKNPAAANLLEKLGFTQPDPFFVAHMRTWKHLQKQAQAWAAAKFSLSKASAETMAEFYTQWVNKMSTIDHFFGQSTALGLSNFFRTRLKPIPDKKIISPLPLVQEDMVCIVLPIDGHPASARAVLKTVPGVTWKRPDVEDQRQEFYPTLKDLRASLHEIQERGGVITNADELKESIASLRTHSRKMPNFK